MRISEFPGCCAAFICHDFGGTRLSSGQKGAVARSRIKAWLKDKKKILGSGACLVVMTNDRQQTANSVLLELGFKHSAWMSKKQHPASKIRLWWQEPITTEKISDIDDQIKKVNCVNLAPPLPLTRVKRWHCDMGDGREGECYIFLGESDACQFRKEKTDDR